MVVDELPAPSVGSFDRIYDAWCDEVSRWVRVLGGPEADQDDIVQEVFVVVSRRLPSFKGNDPAGWLYRITRRQVRDFRRRVWFKYIFSRTIDGALEQVVCPSLDPAACLEQKQRGRVLDALLEGMNAERRRTLLMSAIGGLSGQDIARLQKVPINTIWSRLYQARKELLHMVAIHNRQQDEEIEPRPSRRAAG